MPTPDKFQFREQILKALEPTGLFVTIEASDPASRTATLRLRDALTYGLLKDISMALRTTSINVVSTVEHGYYGDVDSYLDLEVKDIAPPKCTEDPSRHRWGGSHGVVDCSDCGAHAIKDPPEEPR